MSSKKIGSKSDDNYRKDSTSMLKSSMGGGVSQSIDVSNLDQIQKTINFKDLLLKYRARTECNLPYTIQQVEDVMFITEKNIVALEYIFYQKKGGNYFRLEGDDQDLDVGHGLQHEEGRPVLVDPTKVAEHPLGTDDYPDLNIRQNPMSAFQTKPVNLAQVKTSYLEEKRSRHVKDHQGKRNVCFMETQTARDTGKANEKGEPKYLYGEDAVVEALISLWDISAGGQITKVTERSFEYAMRFKPTKGGEMMLQLSEDKKIVSLPMVDTFAGESGPSNKVLFLAWSTDNLRPVPISKGLRKSIENPPPGKLISMNFVGKTKYVMQIMKLNMKEHRHTVAAGHGHHDHSHHEQVGHVKEKKNSFLRYIFFKTDTGQKIFEIENLYHQNKDPKDVRFLSLLINEKVAKKMKYDEGDNEPEYGEEDDEEEEPEEGSDDEAENESSEDEEKDENISVDAESVEEEEFKEIDTSAIDLDLVFFYAAAMKKELPPQKALSSLRVPENWIWTKKSIPLREILENTNYPTSASKLQDCELPEPAQYIRQIGKEAFKEYNDELKFQRNFFEVPKEMFQSGKKNKEENWETQLEICANKKFKHFAFLNTKKRLYLVYDNNDHTDQVEDNYPMFTVRVGEKSISSHVRNQMCKDYMMLVERIYGEPNTATAFYSRNQKKQLKFTGDHLDAAQDLQHQKDPKANPNDAPWKKLMLQSMTISEGDQEIMMKTQIRNKTKEESAEFEIVERKTISQRHKCVFPIMIYNIGQNKLVIQNTLQNGNQYIYNLPVGEVFVDHIEFKKLHDVGFYPGSLNIEASSRFAFLTHNKKKKQFIVNFLLVDPFYGECQIALFQSSNRFDAGHFAAKKDRDVMVKNIMYATKKNTKDIDFELKIITQYPAHIKTNTLSRQLVESDRESNDSDSHSSSDAESSEEDADSEEKHQKMASLPLIQNNKGYIYYVQTYDGQCIIREINPTSDDIHLQIYEVKCSRCSGFAAVGDSFYFMDEYKILNKLQRMKEQRQLVEEKELYIKDKDRPNYEKSRLFAEMVCNDKYLIQKSKIFYLYDDEPLDEGILDMEELSKNKDAKLASDGVTSLEFQVQRSFASGPFCFQGSNEFTNVYQEGDGYTYKQKIYQFPDSTKTVLISDLQRKCELSTFLDANQILIKIAHRYLLFSALGDFIDEVEFSDLKIEKEEKLAQAKVMYDMELRKSRIAAALNDDKAAEVKKPAFIPRMSKWGGITKAIDTEAIKIKERIGSDDRMVLHKMSQNNRFFLFEDKQKRVFKIYQLRNAAKKARASLFAKVKPEDEGFQKEEWEFQVIQELQFEKSELYNGLFLNPDKEEDVIKFFRAMSPQSRSIKKTVENDGEVYIISVKSDPMHDTIVEVFGSIFYKDGTIKNLMQTLEFDHNAKHDIEQILGQKRLQLLDQKEIKIQEQETLPKNFRDDSKIQEIDKKLADLQSRKDNIYAAYVFNPDLLVITCGRFIKYITVNETMFNDDKDSENVFTDAAVSFGKSVEISKVWSTVIPGVLTIVGVDNEKRIMIVVTWNFNLNTEYSMLQVRFEAHQKPENYVVKGINQKLNYFVSQYQIYDLEHNMPLQNANNQSITGMGIGFKYIEQRKIYVDSSRSLSLNSHNLMNFPQSRMDLLFWHNIVQLGEEAGTISKNISLERLNVVYNGYSLFHYFNDNIDVISMMHEKFKSKREENAIKPSEDQVPLIMLHPDKDGKTALDLAIENQMPRSFELMIDLLSDYKDLCLSKALTGSMQPMIETATDIIKDYFHGTYKPPLMQTPLIIPWPDDVEEFIYASPTSLIDPMKLIDTMFQAGHISAKDIEQLQKPQDDALETFSLFSQNLTKQKELGLRQNIRSQALHVDTGKESRLKRVSMEALDLDWIFFEDNCERFITLLCKQERLNLYVQKSIRVFIDFVWSRYQPAIVKQVFLPYMVYLIFFVYFCSGAAGNYLGQKEAQFDKAEEEAYSDLQGAILLYLFGFVSWGLWFYQLNREYQQIRTDLAGYFLEVWNIIDMTSILLNLWVFIMIFWDLHCSSKEELFTIERIRSRAGASIFFMWIKVFYWMRLFRNSGYYITLILQTINDIKVFMGLVALIIVAFANVFFLLQLNVPAGADPIVKSYYGNPILDSFIATYMMALGDFNYDGFAAFAYDGEAWGFFLCGTFICLIVFMNMLIAIMGNTFSKVMDHQIENSLQENLHLIFDHIWLLDLRKEFQNMKYIIRIHPDTHQADDGINISDQITEMTNLLTKRVDLQNINLLKRIEAFEKNNRLLQKNQTQKAMTLKTLMTDLSLEVKKLQTEQHNIVHFLSEGKFRTSVVHEHQHLPAEQPSQQPNDQEQAAHPHEH